MRHSIGIKTGMNTVKKNNTERNKLVLKNRLEREAIKNALTFDKRGRYARRRLRWPK